MIEKLEEDRGDHKVDEYQARKDGRGKHLSNSIRYIMNPKKQKMENGLVEMQE